jgi:N,N-dimethylformamidase
MQIVGYSDRLSVPPGERIHFMVSCEGADTYRADIVQLIHGDTNPAGPGFKERDVQTPVSKEYPARTQAIHSGSYVLVAHDDAFSIPAVSLQAMIWPTTPAKGAQGLITKWSAADQGGYALVIDDGGCLALRLGDGAGQIEEVSTEKPLLAGCWYYVRGSRDEDGTVEVEQEPLVGPANGRFSLPSPAAPTAAHVERRTSVHPAPNGAPVVMAGWYEGTDDGRIVVGGKYNGKIDRPRISRHPMSLDHMDRPRRDGTVAAWDFADGITLHGVHTSLVTDVGPRGLDGELVNRPTRAMTGYNWTSEEQNFVHAPEQYGAIHFHDDDLDNAGWKVDFELAVPDHLHSGIYAARLRAGDAEDYVPFYVRPKPGQEAKIAFLAPTASYMAYANDHLTTNAALAELFIARTPVMQQQDLFLAEHREYGLSTYDTHSDGSGVCHSSRLRPILNMRPKYRHWLSPSLWQFNADLHLVDWLTEMGYEFDVITDQDLNYEGVDLLTPYRVVLTGSHPEYYSGTMLDAVEAYQQQGGRFMYMGANGFYWIIAYHPTNPNVIEVRKGNGSNGWKAQPGEFNLSFTGEYGTLWRYRSRAPQKIAGTGFVAEGFDISSYYRRKPDSHDPRVAFIFEGVADEILGDFGLVGGGAAGLELDIYDELLGTPPHTLLLASSEKHTAVYLEVLEELFFNVPGADGPNNPRVRADIVYYTTPNGGAVFSVSSIAYCGSLSHNNYDNDVSRMTKNVLDRFSAEVPLPSLIEEAPAAAAR